MVVGLGPRVPPELAGTDSEWKEMQRLFTREVFAFGCFFMLTVGCFPSETQEEQWCCWTQERTSEG